jgi:hypothetical protein
MRIMCITVAIVLELDMVTIFTTVASVPLRNIVAFLPNGYQLSLVSCG